MNKIFIMLAAFGLFLLSDSQVEAGFLKNSVRVGERAKGAFLRPPSRNARKRIFQPGERRERAARRGRASIRHDWFWREHLPDAAPDPSRWTLALQTLRDRHASDQRIWTEGKVREIASLWRDPIIEAAARHNLSEALILAVITTESLGQAKARSPKGAQGLMQLIPATAARFGVRDSFDPRQNIQGGAAYLAFLLEHFGEDPILALAGYNSGEGAVRKHKGVPPYAETRDYVAKVFDALAIAETMCLPRPQGPRARCFWAADPVRSSALNPTPGLAARPINRP